MTINWYSSPSTTVVKDSYSISELKYFSLICASFPFSIYPIAIHSLFLKLAFVDKLSKNIPLKKFAVLSVGLDAIPVSASRVYSATNSVLWYIVTYIILGPTSVQVTLSGL